MVLILTWSTITKVSETFQSPTYNVHKVQVRTQTLNQMIKNDPLQSNLRQLEQYLNTDNVTEVYLKRNEFCNKVNDILKLPNELMTKQAPTAMQTVKLLELFSTKVANYLHQSSVSSVHVGQSHFAWAASLQQNLSVRVTSTSSIQNVRIKFNTTKDNEPASISGITDDIHILCSATLPRKAFSGAVEKVIHAIIFRETTIFVDEKSSTIASPILSIAIDNFTPRPLDSPIELIFRKTNDAPGKLVCVYFEFGGDGALGRWKRSGCRKTKETKHFVHCECHHLTNFALLLDVSQTGINFFYLKLITWVGCSFSLIGLIITIFVYSFATSIQKSLGSKIVVQLSISMALLIVIFLAFSENRSKDERDVYCMAASVSIHYLLLVSYPF